MSKKTSFELTRFLIIIFSVFSIVEVRSQVKQVISKDSLNKIDLKGKKQGAWKKYYSNGKLRYEGQFKDDMPYGQFNYYYETALKDKDQIKSVSVYYNGGKASHTVHYFPQGKKLAEGNYIGTNKDSLWKYYNEVGILVSEEFYKGNKKNGVWKVFYYDTGKISEEETWKDDELTGPAKEYFDNGKVKVEKKYDNGKLQGIYYVYDTNGNAIYAGKYDKGIKTGTWVELRSNGTQKIQDTYKNGKLIKHVDLRTKEEKADEDIVDPGKGNTKFDDPEKSNKTQENYEFK